MKNTRSTRHSRTIRGATAVGLLAALMMLVDKPGCAAEIGLDFSLLAAQESLVSGEQGTADLVVINRLSHEMTPALPPILNGTIIDGPNRWLVQLVVDRAALTGPIPSRGFVLVPLSFELPEGMSGSVELAMDEPAPLRAILEISDSSSAGDDDTVADTPKEQPWPSHFGESARPLAIAHMTRYYAANLGVYEPVYFLYGSEAPAAKFQFSFKYRLIADDGWLAQKVPFMRGLTFAYTQRTLWDTGADSSPFYDTSYMPELGFFFLASEHEQHGLFTWLGWQAAFQHESNGMSGPDSRSLNIVFVRPAFAIGDLDGWHVIVVPKLFTYAGVSNKNNDIADYRGYGELRLVLAKNGGLALSVAGQIGQGFEHGAVQVDLTVPTRMLSNTIASYIHVQYWNGYGESLLDYDKHTDAVRIGLSFVR